MRSASHAVPYKSHHVMAVLASGDERVREVAR
jgi:hypothetical protein